MQPGDRAPDFELPDETGQPRRLSDMLRAGPVVLFFYPRAMTSGCTAEACHFRDLRTEFERVGAQRIGISLDPVNKQKQFSDKHDFDYPLLSDKDGSVARGYGVSPGLLSFIRPVKRTTFVIGRADLGRDQQRNTHAHPRRPCSSDAERRLSGGPHGSADYGGAAATRRRRASDVDLWTAGRPRGRGA
jgi:peroxiredoxin Q/BCP